MKAISLKEPWASLVSEKIKCIETRSWFTKYRGELYIHVSKRKLTKNDLLIFKEQLNLLKVKNFRYGYIIAKCNLVDCKYMNENFINEIKNNHKEYICGNYKIGRYAWILKNIEVLEKPIEHKGQLGIWNFI